MANKYLDFAGLQRLVNKIKELIPTRTSELDNDNGFITIEDIPDSTWESIQNKPDTFTPSEHNHTIGNIIDLQNELNSKETPSGSQSKANIAESNAKSYVDGKVLTDVPINAKFTDTITTINGKTGAISKADIVALGIPAQDTNTTYSEITTAEIDTGTASTLRTITGRRVKYILDKVQGWIGGLTKSDVGLSNVDNVKQASKTEFDEHLADDTKHITSTERTIWNNKLDASAYTAADVLAKVKTVDGDGSGLDADLLDGAHAGNGPNNVLKLDSGGFVPLPNIPGTLTGKSADMVDGKHFSDIQNDAQAKVDTHANLTNNPHSVTKSQVGLGSVSNYGLATQAEAEAGTSSAKYMTPLRTKQAIDALQAVKSVAGKTGTVTLTKGDVGLSNVDNTSDMDKPISTATQTALANKVDNSRVLTDVPANAKFTDTVYEHPSTHSADIIVDGTTNKVFTAIEKTKLSGIEAGANNYTHPATHSADIIVDGTTNKVFTAAEKTKLSGIKAGAEVNQNAFSNIKVGTTTIAADSKTDTLELTAGTGITLTPDATNDKVTVSVASAPKLTTARTISLSGDVSGSTSFNGSANVTITATVADDSHNHIISNIDNLQSTLDAKASVSHTHTSSEITDFNEATQDAIGAILTDTSTIDFTYNDTNNQIKADVKPNSSNQKVAISKNSVTPTGTRKQINFKDGTNISVTVADNATNDAVDVTITNTYTHPTGDGNLHVPATGTTNNGKVLKAGSTAGSLSWGTLSKSDVGLGNVDNTADSAKSVLSAAKLTTPRTISLTGDVTGSVSFDGSANASITATVADDSHNHVISNVDGLQAALDAKETPAGAQAKVDTHANLTNNPHSVTKSQVGLGSVSNYGLATQAEAEAGTSSAKYMTPLRTKQAIDALQAVKSVAGKTGTVTLTKGDVGLSNVDNTSDMDKPISTATQTALANKVDNSRVLTDVPANAKFTDTTYSEITTSEIDAGTASTLRTITGRRVKYILDKVQGWIGGLTKSDVGLSNVDNVKQMPISGGVLENYREKLVTLSGTSTAINLSLGNVFTHSLTGNTTYSITNAVSGQAHSFTLIITQTATVRTITFPASVKWQGGEIPDMTTASKTYILTFMTINGGTNWLGMFGGEF